MIQRRERDTYISGKIIYKTKIKVLFSLSSFLPPLPHFHLSFLPLSLLVPFSLCLFPLSPQPPSFPSPCLPSTSLFSFSLPTPVSHPPLFPFTSLFYNSISPSFPLFTPPSFSLFTPPSFPLFTPPSFLPPPSISLYRCQHFVNIKSII